MGVSKLADLRGREIIELRQIDPLTHRRRETPTQVCLESNDFGPPGTRCTALGPAVQFEEMDENLLQEGLHCVELGQSHALDLLDNARLVDVVDPFSPRDTAE